MRSEPGYNGEVFFRRRHVPAFAFVDPGPLRDGELSLVAPTRTHAAAFLDSLAHPDCQAEPECVVSPSALDVFLDAVPNGRERCDPRTGCLAAYRFWMRLGPTPARGDGGRIALVEPPVEFAGTITLRIGSGENLTRHVGHVGYLVFPPARGRRLAERATRLLLPLARQHGMRALWITVNPDNAPSRRTVERLGGELVDIIDLPRHHALYARGDRQKCRYRLAL